MFDWSGEFSIAHFTWNILAEGRYLFELILRVIPFAIFVPPKTAITTRITEDLCVPFFDFNFLIFERFGPYLGLKPYRRYSEHFAPTQTQYCFWFETPSDLFLSI